MQSNDLPPPIPPPIVKTGPSAFTVFGIGCGSLALIFMISLAVLLGKGCLMVREFSEDFKKNPGKMAITLMLKGNPDIELISSDDAKKEITVRTKSNGEVLTVSYANFEQGKLHLKNAKGEEVSINIADFGRPGAPVTQVSQGTNAPPISTSPPAWVPIYPGMEITVPGVPATGADGMVTGTIVGIVGENQKTVGDFYVSQMNDLGMKPTANFAVSAKGGSSTIHGANKDGTRSLQVSIVEQKGESLITISYTGSAK